MHLLRPEVNFDKFLNPSLAATIPSLHFDLNCPKFDDSLFPIQLNLSSQLMPYVTQTISWSVCHLFGS
ncbi:MAG: hypothetical protein EZS28_042184 [Streblomastix strix]|uniref:Uncharacterized protein n=1 Tax=Streblomastix strix TaxID=222440 RepID=A0A5J4TWN1_9EUKA|nr:MAG: hypothetical protein EZS28_042184 [Streblomastix strix]